MFVTILNEFKIELRYNSSFLSLNSTVALTLVGISKINELKLSSILLSIKSSFVSIFSNLKTTSEFLANSSSSCIVSKIATLDSKKNSFVYKYH